MSLALTIAEAITESRVGRSSLYSAIKRGELPCRKLGKRSLILREDLERFLQSLPVRDTSAAA